MYTTPVVASANWFDARITFSFGSTRDVFPNDLVFPRMQLCRACLLCLVGPLLR
jgi:hypothetical protein